MGIILSLSFKNFADNVFITKLDFDLLIPRLVAIESLDGSGFKRKQVEMAVQDEDSEPLTHGSLPSSLSLDDKLIPGKLGVLEQITYSGSVKKSQDNILPEFLTSYLFFGMAPLTRHSMYAFNPAPVFIQSTPENLTTYSRSHQIKSIFEYSADMPYEPLPQFKISEITAYEPIPKVLQIFAYIAQVKSPYISSMKPKSFVQYNTSSPYLTNARTRQYDEPAAMQAYSNIIKSYITSKSELPAREILRIQPQIMDIKLASQKTISQENYKTEQYQYTPQSQIKVTDSSLDSRIRISYQDQYSTNNPKTRYSQNHNAPSPKVLDLNQFRYSRINKQQMTPASKNLVANAARNYSQLEWRVTFKKPSKVKSLYQQPYQQPQKEESPIEYKTKKINSIRREEAYEPENEEKQSYEEIKPTGEISGQKAQKIKQAYEKQNILDKLKQNHESEEENNSGYKQNSAIGDAAAVAGAGLAGLVALVSLPFTKKSREIERPNLQLVYDKPTDAQKTRNETIDSVVASPVNNEAIFTPEVKNGLELLLNEARQLYGSVVISVENYKTGKHYDNGGGNEETSPCLNKVPLAFVVRYLAQQGRFDLTKKIKFDKSLALEWEVKKNPDDFHEGALLGYERLEELMMTISSNTSYNHILKLIAESIIGEGTDVRESFPIINDELRKIGFYSTKVKSLHLKDEPYRLNVSSSNDAVKIIRYILTQQYLKDSQALKKHLSNERPGAVLRELYLKDIDDIDKGTKFTLFEDGTGFVGFAGDFIFSLIYNKPLAEPMYIRDENGEKKPNQIFYKTGIINEKLFKFMHEYLLKNNQSREQYQHKKAA